MADEDVCFERLQAKTQHERLPRPVLFLRKFNAAVLFLLSPMVLLSMLISVFALVASSPAAFDLRTQLVLGPIILGFVFPLTFIIRATWARRESARTQLDTLRSSCYHFLWSQDEWFLWLKEDSTTAIPNFDTAAHLADVDRCLKNLLLITIDYLTTRERSVKLSALSNLHVELRTLTHMSQRGGQAWGNQIVGGIGSVRLHCAVDTIKASIDGLIGTKDTSTPFGLKVFGWIAALFSPMVLAPHFAQIECPLTQENPVEVCGYGNASAYVSGLFYSFIIGSLFTIGMELEDPFDGVGDDDLNLVGQYEDYRSLCELGSHDPPSDPLHYASDKAPPTQQYLTPMQQVALVMRPRTNTSTFAI